MKQAILMTAVLCVIFSGCKFSQGAVTPTPTPEQAPILKTGKVLENTPADDTGYQLYRFMASNPKNVNLSPLSLKLAFALTYPGAKGDTRKMLEQIFSLSSDDANPFHAELELSNKIATAHVDGSELQIARSAWVKDLKSLKPEFVESLKAMGAPIAALSVEKMNAWVAEATHGKIGKIVDDLGKNMQAVFVNAIYFKQKWSSPFDEKQTTVDAFQSSVHAAQNVSTMHGKKDVLYGEDSISKWIALPYTNSPFMMYLVIPTQRFDLRSIDDKLAGTYVKEMIAKMKQSSVEIALPKFKFEERESFRKLFEQAGYGELFSRGDFSGISSAAKFKLSDVIQATSIEVNEGGTEASAATGAMMLTRAKISQPLMTKTFIADQPFLFLLRNEESKEIYWLGKVYHVQQ